MTQVKAKSVTGSVVSVGRDKSVTVQIERKTMHPKYKKFIKRTTKLHAHDENNECKLGDIVVIQECRPISKTKSWMLVEVLR